jgi:hypothetical protein
MIEAMDELRTIAMRAGKLWTDTGLRAWQWCARRPARIRSIEPMLHLVLQGTKSLSIGNEILNLGAADYFIVPVDLPATGEIAPA